MLCFWLLLAAVGQAEPVHRDWSGVTSFVYQLQDLDFSRVRECDPDLVIMDYSADGSSQQRYSPEQLESLRERAGGKRRLLLAYLCLGEAEEYRFYWKGKRQARREGWLGRSNRDWPEHHRARFWLPTWQTHMDRYLDQILEAGFDGVYLDRVDVYREVDLNPGLARERMLAFVQRLAERARSKEGKDFGVFVQNAEELLEDPSYLSLLTGVGRESVYYEARPDRSGLPHKYSAEVEQTLDRAVAAGKLVLSVDYPRNSRQAAQARSRARARGYLHFAALRELDCLPVW